MRVGPDNGTPNSTESIISIPSHASGWIYFQPLNGIHILQYIGNPHLRAF